MRFLNGSGLAYLWKKILSLVGTKVDKIEGKYLSSNDYTTEEKEKVASLAGMTIDSELSETSENSVQNKVVTSALNDKINTSDMTAITNAEIDAIIDAEN